MALAWLLAFYQFRILGRLRSPLAASYWSAFLFAALSRGFDVPAVYTAVDSIVGYPNLSEFLSSICVILAVLSVQVFVYLSLLPHRAEFRVVPLVTGVSSLLAMVALFFVGGPVPKLLDNEQYYGVPGSIAAFRAVYLAYLLLSGLVLISVLTRYALAGQEARIKVGFGLMAVGGTFGLLHVANDVGALFPPNLRPFKWWGEAWFGEVMTFPFFLLFVTGALMPVWDRTLRAFRAQVAFLRLRGLWRELRNVCPEVGLLPNRTMLQDILDPRDATFRLHQQVAEIRDAAFIISAFADLRVLQVAKNIADRLPDLRERAALVEAAQVRAGMEARRRGLPAQKGAREAPCAQSTGLQEEVRHLMLVARHVAGSPVMRLLLERLKQSSEMVPSTSRTDVWMKNG